MEAESRDENANKLRTTKSSPDNGFCPSPPGSCFSDKSVELYRDIVSFFNSKAAQLNSRLFNTRILMKTTTIVGSNSGVHQLLNESAKSFQFGYKDYFSHIYGDVILFAEDVCAKDMRFALLPLFRQASIDSWKSKVEEIVKNFWDSVDISKSVCIYSVFKQLASELMICLFLDLNPKDSRPIIDQIVTLSVVHWHGIISLPFTWRVPLGFSGGCRKALDAKEKLLKIVKERWNNCSDRNSFLYRFKETFFETEDVALDHLVLLITALVPKAFASILASTLLCGNQWKDMRQTDGTLEKNIIDCVLLEVGRLWPPFVGGRRVATENAYIDGFMIPVGRPVIFLSHSAHRDPAVFAHPDQFSWDRWQKENRHDQDKVFCFGAGLRSCIGKFLANFVLQEVLQQFLGRFDWSFESNSPVLFKWLPVCRPKVKPEALLTLRK